MPQGVPDVNFGNRLDSRQRKKQHTERLEEEKKHNSTVISDLEEGINELRVRETEWVQLKEHWETCNQQLQQRVRELEMDKEDLVRRHTIETGELRKKNAYFVEQAQKLEAISMSAVPSSTGYSADFSDFDLSTMATSPWDNFSIVNDFTLEAEPKQENPMVLIPKKEHTAVKEDEKTATSGLLLMLLLCGAWVASQSTASPPAKMPDVSEDVRIASTIVLDNLYKDAGLQPPQIASSLPKPEKRVSDVSAAAMKTTLSAAEIAVLSNSPLTSLHHQLISPTTEQRRDQVLSLSTDQYSTITSGEFIDETISPASYHRRNLQEVLTSMRSNRPGPAAEAYTRSLLWNEVPQDIIRDFARKVADCNSGRVVRGDVDDHRCGEPMN